VGSRLLFAHATCRVGGPVVTIPGEDTEKPRRHDRMRAARLPVRAAMSGSGSAGLRHRYARAGPVAVAGPLCQPPQRIFHSAATISASVIGSSISRPSTAKRIGGRAAVARCGGVMSMPYHTALILQDYAGRPGAAPLFLQKERAAWRS